jgi:cytoskeletal protein CcmA (bactofilin family)
MKPKFIPLLLVALSLVAIFTLVLAAPARAFDHRSGDSILIPEGEVVNDDLYLFGNTITINGTVKGDVVAFGSTITIGQTGIVEEDLTAAGQSVTVNGQVQDDARIAGAALLVDSNGVIGEDLIGAGYSLEARPGSQIGQDVVFGGGQAVLAGDIGGDVQVGANSLVIQGSIAGDVYAELGRAENMPSFMPFSFMPNMPQVPSVPGGLTVRPGAEIGGDLDYTSLQQASIPPGAVAGETSHQVPELPESKPEEAPEEKPAEKVEIKRDDGFTRVSRWFFSNLQGFLALMVVGLLMVWLLPRFVNNSVAALQAKPWPSLGWGFVSLIAFFIVFMALIAIVVLLSIFLGIITLGELVGITLWAGFLALGAFMFFVVFAITYISKIIVSFLVGRWIVSKIQPEWAEKPWLPLIVGVVLFAILASIPWLGNLFAFVVILFGLGALWLLGLQRFYTKSSAPTAGD